MRLLAALGVSALLTGCMAGANATPMAKTPSPGASASGAAGTPAEASASPGVRSVIDLTYGATGALTKPEQLDVYSPLKAGPWPTVVMLHGWPPGVSSKADWYPAAQALAGQGFVVFVANWGELASGTPGAVPTAAQMRAYASEAACAVAYARNHAGEYGGDPGTMIVFGHSGGANLAGDVAFTRPSPTAGCPGGTTVGPIHALVTWDGDWTLTDPTWDGALAADPSRWAASTPLVHIASDKTLKVVVLMSEYVDVYVRDLSDPKAMDAFFAARDSTGALRAQLGAIGVLDDKAYDIKEMQQLFSTRLKAQGNSVTLTELPGAHHDHLGVNALPAFVSAFTVAAAN